MELRLSTKNKIYLLILFSSIGFRIAFSSPIEFNGESILKWRIGVELFSSWDFRILADGHQEMRWGLVVPYILLAPIIKSYVAYYIWPIVLVGAFSVIGASFLSNRQINAFPMVLVALAISFEPMSHVMGSQISSGTFGIFYLFGAFLFLLKYIKTNNTIFLVLSSIAAFFTYGSHITYILFVSGMVLFLIIHLRAYKTAGWFLLLLGVMVGIETLFFRSISGEVETIGRMGNLLFGKTHQGAVAHGSGTGFEVKHFFLRWKTVPKYDFLIMVSFLLGSSTLISRKARKNIPDGVLLCFYSAGIYGLGVSFPIVGFQPTPEWMEVQYSTVPRLALDLHSRYLAPFFPIAVVFSVWSFAYSINRFPKRSQRTIFATLGVLGVSSFLYGTIYLDCSQEIGEQNVGGRSESKIEAMYCKTFRYSQEQNVYPRAEFFVLRANSYYKEFNRDYINGDVALFGGTRIGVFKKFIRVEYPEAVFLENNDGWYSVDGGPQKKCAMELRQIGRPEENYANCENLWMSRGVFKGER